MYLAFNSVAKEPILTVTLSEEFMAECILSVLRAEGRPWWPQILMTLVTRHDSSQHRTVFHVNRK